LSYNFAEAVTRLKLSPRDIKTLILVLDLKYKSCISYLDELFGQIVDAVANAGLLDQSLIVFTSDHGELLYRKDAPFQWTHGFMLAPEDLSIPLIIRGPQITPGLYKNVTRSIDVFPTVAGLSGFRLPDGRVMGEDLSLAVLKKIPEPRLVAYSHTGLMPAEFVEEVKALPTFHRLFPSVGIDWLWVAAREGDIVYKLKSPGGGNVQPEVYDWKADPRETQNLFDPANQHQAGDHSMRKSVLNACVAWATFIEPLCGGSKEPIVHQRES
jgi:arylsulfatase A-like enzyme